MFTGTLHREGGRNHALTLITPFRRPKSAGCQALYAPSSAMKSREPCKDSRDQQGGDLEHLKFLLSPMHTPFLLHAASHVGPRAFSSREPPPRGCMVLPRCDLDWGGDKSHKRWLTV